LRKGKKERRGELSDEESEDEVIRMETGLESDNEEEEGKEGQEKIDELTRKLLQLNVKDNAYTATYAQLFVLASEMINNLPPPSHFGASTVMATSATMIPSYPKYSQPTASMLCNFSCHFCKKPECHLRTCPTATEYVQSGRALLQPNGYYAHPNGLLIDTHHPGGLKRAIDIKNNGRDTPPNLVRIIAMSTKLSSFVEATQVEEEELVWGVIAELESKKEKVGELVMMRAQGKKEVEKGADKGGEGGEQWINRSGKKKTEEI